MKQKLTLMLVCLFALLTKATATVDSDLMNLVTKPSNVTITSLTNDPTYPWEKQEDGSFKRTGNLGNYYNYKNSEITLEMSCTHPTYITFSYVQSLYSSSDESRTYRDGIQWTRNNGNTTEGKTNSTGYILEPGTHTIRFTLSSYAGNNSTYVTLKSIKIEDLEDKYIKINLSAPGTLGEEALEKVATLPDMRYLRQVIAHGACDDLTGPVYTFATKQQANLTVTAIETPEDAEALTTFTVKATIKNTGKGTTIRTSWTDAIYRSTTADGIASATQVDTKNHSGALAPDGSYEVTFTVSVPDATIGQVYYYVKTDYNNSETEFFEVSVCPFVRFGHKKSVSFYETPLSM